MGWDFIAANRPLASLGSMQVYAFVSLHHPLLTSYLRFSPLSGVWVISYFLSFFSVCFSREFLSKFVDYIWYTVNSFRFPCNRYCEFRDE